MMIMSNILPIVRLLSFLGPVKPEVFLDSQEFSGLRHVADPNREEQERVWGSKENKERRKRCFELAFQKSVAPIQLALSFVLNQKFPSFPLIGPRNFFETESSLEAIKIDLTADEISWLNLNSETIK